MHTCGLKYSAGVAVADVVAFEVSVAVSFAEWSATGVGGLGGVEGVRMSVGAGITAVGELSCCILV